MDIEEDPSNATILTETESAVVVLFDNDQYYRLENSYLFCYCVFIIVTNLFFIYVIVKNSLNRSPFYLVMLHMSIFSISYISCGALATFSSGIPNYGYHIFTNSKHTVISFETILFTIFVYDWFIKSEEYCRNIIVVFWIVTISFIFLGCIAVGCGDRLFYSFFILTFITYTALLITFSITAALEFKKIVRDEKYRIRTLLALAYVVCFLPNYLLLIFDSYLYHYKVIDFICPVLMYGHSFINIASIMFLDSYLRLHFRKTFKPIKTYQQNSHFPVDDV